MNHESEGNAGSSALARALVAIETLEARLASAERARSEPIAIIGMSGRFPGGANSPDQYWRLLHDGVDAISEAPPARWDVDAYYDPDPEAPGKVYTRCGGFIDGIEQFDAGFFGIAPREAASMDPQHRLLLETAWETLEDAGQPADRLFGSPTGLYIGVGANDHSRLIIDERNLAGIDVHMASGSACSIAVGRIAYALGLQGPAIAIDTACSSALVAVHVACLALRNDECRLALAGGVNTILSPLTMVVTCRMRMLAPDGRCKTFDASADGFARSDGCGLFALKRLSDAVADRDRILGVIRGSAMNQDGRTSGLTVPNGPAQEALIRAALRAARVSPADLDYVEAHGTGTALGDPIELRALGNVFAERPRERPLLVGSSKTNIGHAETAAGAAGLMKVVLALREGEIPPHLHIKTPNPKIEWSTLPIRVPAQAVSWPSGSRPRLAGVSSFGYSGTNAHVIVEEPPAVSADSPQGVADRPLHVLALSAKTEAALRALVERYVAYLRSHPQTPFANVCFTANAGRSHFAHRLALVAPDAEDAVRKLEAWLAGDASGVRAGQKSPGRPPRIAFLFTGQGSQYAGMGRELYQNQPVFRAALDACDQALRPILGRSVLDLLQPGPDAESLLEQTSYQQPALFALEYALASLWRSWGIEPSFVMGHSAGEYAAACIAGVFSPQDGARLIADRARLMQNAPGSGAMAAVAADEPKVASLLPSDGSVVIAGVNSPQQTVVSGDANAVETFLVRAREAGLRGQRLRVSHAFHSPLMEPVLAEFETRAATAAFSPPRIGFVSNVDGRLAAADTKLNAAYWRTHIRRPVRFLDGVRTVIEKGVDVLIEIGPGAALLGLGRAAGGADAAKWLPSIRRGSDASTMLASLVELYVAGVTIDWEAFDRPFPRQRVGLPTYPFQHDHYPIGDGRLRRPPDAATARGGHAIQHPLLHRRLRSALPAIQFESELAANRPAYVQDHRVYGSVIMPGACFVEMGLAAGRELLGDGPVRLERFAIQSPLTLDEAPYAVQCIVHREPDAAARFEVLSQSSGDEAADEPWQTHAAGRVAPAPAAGAASVDGLAGLRAACTEAVDVPQLYETLAAGGLEFGPRFRCIESLWRGENLAVARVKLGADSAADAGRYRIHPLLLDAAWQSIAALRTPRSGGGLFIPMGLDSLDWRGSPGAAAWVAARLRNPNDAADSLRIDLDIMDDAGHAAVSIAGLTLKRAPRETLRRAESRRINDWLFEVRWRPQPLASARRAASDLPDPADVAAAVAPAWPAIGRECGMAGQARMLAEMERLSVRYAVEAFERLGVSMRPGDRFSVNSLIESLRPAPPHRRLLARMAEMLAAGGVLRPRGDEWEVAAAPDGPKAEETWFRIREAFPASDAELQLLHRCGSNLADVIRGRCDPLGLLFPDGSIESMRRVYGESPFARAMNRAVQTAVQTAVSKLPSGRRVRILEIGAGTGGTTSSVIAGAGPRYHEYVFSDVSPMFLAAARHRLTAQKGMRFEMLDIERPPADQGFGGDEYDLIVAVNVLHATADLRRTLANVRALLAPGGMLLLVETNWRMNWTDLVFGLTEGWWRFADQDLRPDYALLPAARWRTLLAECGFADATTAVDADSDSGTFQSLIIARRPVEMAAGVAPVANDPAPATWLVLADGGQVADELARLLTEAAQRCVIVRPGAAFSSVRPGAEYRLSPTDAAGFKRLTAELRASIGGPLRGAIHLWPLDVPAFDALDGESLRVAQETCCASTLHLVQALTTGEDRPGVWLVTRGAQPVMPDAGAVGAAAASLWGMGRVVAHEYTNLKCVRIDLDPAAPAAQNAQDLFGELLGGDAEDEVAYRVGQRFVSRLDRCGGSDAAGLRLQPPDDRPFLLEARPPGTFDHMQLTPVERRSPAAGEVEVRVAASGLNFRDVLNALNALPAAGGPLGGECAGTIAAVGPGVTDFAVGDAVVAFAPGSFASYVTVDARLVARTPPGVSAEEAVTVTTTVATALYGLVHRAGMKKGDRVLVHAAAGGVGLAAVQLAKHVGAEVIATAGSPRKRAFLRGLGIEHIFDSRSLDFAEGVMTCTNGHGVDIVLNCLARDFIPRSIDVLAPGGRFVELGKTGIWTDEQVRARRSDVTYHLILLDRMSIDDPPAIRAILREVMDLLASGAVRPLPSRVFPITAAPDAFRFMAQARHIGKIVVSIEPSGPPPGEFRPDATYLITGGLGGLGLVVARWMAERGARHLVLTGRRAPNEAARAVIDQIRGAGVDVRVMQADASDGGDVQRVLAEIGRDMPPLRGIMHSAGVLDDGVLPLQTWPRFTKVFAPKISGTWLLHEATAAAHLDFFVLYSSKAAQVGPQSQANHAAANAFMDAFAHAARADGRRVTSVNWGPWSETGAAQELGAEALRKWQLHGIGGISNVAGCDARGETMRRDATQVAVIPLNVPVFARSYRAPLFADLANTAPQSERAAAAAESTDGFRERLKSARPDERTALARGFIVEQAGKVLGLPASRPPPPNQHLGELGLDSLMAIELKSRLEAGFGCTLPTTVALDHPTIDALVEFLSAATDGGAPATPATAPPAASRPDPRTASEGELLEKLPELSDQEVDSLLDEMLERKAPAR